jgi:HSP20 family protein
MTLTINRMNRLPSLFRDLDEFWREFAAPYGARADGAEAALTPPVDIVESDKAVELHLDLPGMDPEKIDVKVVGNVLTISSERKSEKTSEGKDWVRQERTWGTYARSFTLPNNLDGSAPEATYKHGVLKVVLPKKEEAAGRSLKVKVEA